MIAGSGIRKRRKYPVAAEKTKLMHLIFLPKSDVTLEFLLLEGRSFAVTHVCISSSAAVKSLFYLTAGSSNEIDTDTQKVMNTQKYIKRAFFFFFLCAKCRRILAKKVKTPADVLECQKSSCFPFANSHAWGSLSGQGC